MDSNIKKTKKRLIRKDKRYRSKKKLVNEVNFDEATENDSLRNISLEERRKEARKPLFLRRYE